MKTNTRRAHSNIETLEARIAPAAVMLTDLNGDHIHFISSSSAFNSGDISVYSIGDGHHYSFVVNLSGSEFNGSSLTVSAGKVLGGDGQTYVSITAGSNNLNNIDINGDLGLLVAGAISSETAIHSLTVNSIGRFPTLPTADLLVISTITGSISKFTVKGDMDGTFMNVMGNIGSLFIGGSLIGGDIPGDGEIVVGGNIGHATVKHDVRGGYGLDSGVIYADGKLGPFFVGGSLYGGTGAASAEIGAGGTATSIDIAGSIFGGDGNFSGQIFGNAAGGSIIDKVVVGGSVVGGSGMDSGQIGNGNATASVILNDVVIGGSLIGGSCPVSGSVYEPFGTIDTLIVKGSVFGGAGSNSGYISAAGTAGSVIIGGSVFGGYGGGSGYIALSGGLDTLTLGGSLVGGSGPDSGDIGLGSGTVNHLMRIDGDVRGSTGSGSGSITTNGGEEPVILGEVFAGSGPNSGIVGT